MLLSVVWGPPITSHRWRVCVCVGMCSGYVVDGVPVMVRIYWRVLGKMENQPSGGAHTEAKNVITIK